MIYKKDICDFCFEERYIVKNLPGRKLCQTCNKIRLSTREPKQNKVSKKKKKPSGERELFLSIWESRDHICVNCKEHLGDEPLAHFFAHIVPKGRAPELRLDPDNVRILCFDCHYILDHGTKEQYDKRTKS